MATIKKYNGSTWENTIARKYETKSEIIVPPTTIYADGSNITTYTIKGNTVQNGTPTPSAPISVQGVGELETTGEHSGEYKIPISSGGVTTNIYLGSTQTVRQVKKLVLTGNENISNATQLTVGYRFSINIPTGKLSSAQTSSICTHFVYKTDWNNLGFTFGNADNQLFIMADISGVNDTTTFANWLADQYANGTPVTIWYVLATAETAAVNEPLMKIGNYADTLSNAASIPTTEGANSITVDTTVQPSEFTASWTGWHNASVKEWDGSDWQ